MAEVQTPRLDAFKAAQSQPMAAATPRLDAFKAAQTPYSPGQYSGMGGLSITPNASLMNGGFVNDGLKSATYTPEGRALPEGPAPALIGQYAKPDIEYGSKVINLPGTSVSSPTSTVSSPAPAITPNAGILNGTSPVTSTAAPFQKPASAFGSTAYNSVGAPMNPLKLPAGLSLTPNAGLMNGLVSPPATAQTKITPLNGIANGMPAPNSAVNPPAAVGGGQPSGTDWNAKFKKDTGTTYNGAMSSMDRLNMDRLKAGLPTFNHAEYRSYLRNQPK